MEVAVAVLVVAEVGARGVAERVVEVEALELEAEVLEMRDDMGGEGMGEPAAEQKSVATRAAAVLGLR